VVVHDGIVYVFGFRDPAVHAATDAGDLAILEELVASVSYPG
jgi:hypothetical protein